MKSIPVVISYYEGTKVVEGYPVKIGVLEGVFAATPSCLSFFNDEFVITHLATGLAVPGFSERTVKQAVRAAEKRIMNVGEKRYQEAVLKAIAKFGPRIAKAYAEINNPGS
ncbi:MAG: hypothetical protein NUV63_12215 [Gallionella sp.]|nr:hypothetical protein [Gallionella sp.]